MNWQRVIPATVLASVLAMPGLARAEAPVATGVRLEVDVSALPKGRLTEDTRKWVLKHQKAAFEGEGFVVSDDAERVVRIEISRYGENDINIRARLVVAGDEGSAREFTCEACMDSQFLEKVSVETTALAQRMREADQAEAEPPTEEGAEEVPATSGEPATEGATGDRSTQPPTDEAADQGKRVGAAGYAGIGALALGTGLTIGGAVVAGAEPEVQLQVGDDLAYERTSRRPTGIALVGVGASLVVTGIVLVVVDQTVLRKRRDRQRTAAVLVPSLSSTEVGLALGGRF